MFLRNTDSPVRCRFYSQVFDEEARQRHQKLLDEFIDRQMYWRLIRSGPFVKHFQVVDSYYGCKGPLYHYIFLLDEDVCDEYDRRMKDASESTEVESK